MNREILFRGKRVDNKEWVYGYLVKSEDYIFDYSERIDIPYIIPFDNFNLKDYREYRVIPETIGQYTGLEDNNGKKIFEGDKVKAKFYGKDVIGEIGFNSGCFLLWNSCVSDNQLFIFTDIEVIGNIFDEKE